MQSSNLSLPVRWDGHDFEKAVENLLYEYMTELYLAGEEECADDDIHSYTQVIPQLLMQWVRKPIKRNELLGIRYFSCASIRASELGFDYVFPVCNTSYAEGYCSVLRDSFLLTKPVYLRDYSTVRQCEEFLIHSFDMDKI